MMVAIHNHSLAAAHMGTDLGQNGKLFYVITFYFM